VSRRAQIRAFVLAEFLPGVPSDELPFDEDLVAAGVLDSLGVYVVIAWLQRTYRIDVDDTAIRVDDVRSIDIIDAFVASRLETVTTE
jgi:acyl carrier protein